MGEKKSGKIVGVRFDDEERAALEESAERLGLTKSEYIRYLVSLNFPTFTDEHGDESDGLGDVSTLIVPVLDKSDVQVIKRELIRQGSNINQAAKALNSLARLAGENKALRIDWISFGGVAERALESANESLKEIGARVDALAAGAHYVRHVDERGDGGADA